MPEHAAGRNSSSYSTVTSFRVFFLFCRAQVFLKGVAFAVSLSQAAVWVRVREEEAA